MLFGSGAKKICGLKKNDVHIKCQYSASCEKKFWCYFYKVIDDMVVQEYNAVKL